MKDSQLKALESSLLCMMFKAPTLCVAISMNSIFDTWQGRHNHYNAPSYASILLTSLQSRNQLHMPTRSTLQANTKRTYKCSNYTNARTHNANTPFQRRLAARTFFRSRDLVAEENTIPRSLVVSARVVEADRHGSLSLPISRRSRSQAGTEEQQPV